MFVSACLLCLDLTRALCSEYKAVICEFLSESGLSLNFIGEWFSGNVNSFYIFEVSVEFSLNFLFLFDLKIKVSLFHIETI